jgi:hypothetical protein
VSVDSTVARAHQHAAGARQKGTNSASRRAQTTTPLAARPVARAWGNGAGETRPVHVD